MKIFLVIPDQIKPLYHSDYRLVRLNDDRSGSIPSRSRIRLSALKRLSCFFLSELSISRDKAETFNTSTILNLLSFPCTRTEFNPTFSTKQILHVNLWPSFSNAPRLFKSLTKSPFLINASIFVLYLHIFRCSARFCFRQSK